MNYRKIWQEANGPIPKDEQGRSYEIHHIDGNHTNNSLENLTCISIGEHYEIHLRQKDYAAAALIAERANKETVTGWHISENTKQKMSDSRKGKKHLEETKRKISKANKGRQHTQETKHKLSEIRKNRISKPSSNETKHKISEALKGRKLSQKHKQRLSESKVGKKQSEETRRKMSEIKKGIKRGPYKNQTKKVGELKQR